MWIKYHSCLFRHELICFWTQWTTGQLKWTLSLVKSQILSLHYWLWWRKSPYRLSVNKKNKKSNSSFSGSRFILPTSFSKIIDYCIYQYLIYSHLLLYLYIIYLHMEIYSVIIISIRFKISLIWLWNGVVYLLVFFFSKDT